MASERIKDVDCALTVREGAFDDWYVVERAEHDGKAWFDHTGPNSRALMLSSRITNADIEGTASEMAGIAYAIETRGSYRAKRCCAEVTGDHAVLWSPRNSTYKARVPLARADELAAAIRALIPGGATNDRG